jgi:hypothetical protein
LRSGLKQGEFGPCIQKTVIQGISSDTAARRPIRNGPNGAKLAVQFVVNYEEGGESCILDDDPASEKLLSEIVGADAWPGPAQPQHGIAL